MTTDVLDRIDAEIQLQKQVIDEAQKKIDDLMHLAQLSQRYQHVLSAGPQQIGGALTQVARSLSRRANAAPTLKSQILDTSEQILSDGKRRLSREVAVELEKLGVPVSGFDKGSTISSYLSREKDRFVSDLKKGGWTLVKLTQQKAKPGTALTEPGLYSLHIGAGERQPKLQGQPQ